MNNANNNMNSKLQFVGYNVKRLILIQEDSYKELNKFNVKPQFMREVEFEDENNFTVSLGCKIDASDENPFPFSLEVIITGNFTITGETEYKDTFIKENSTAILFPYLRSTISMLTVNALKTPLILPTMNIVKVLEELEKHSEN